MSETVESALKSLIDRYGVGLLDESGRLKGFLQDECPAAKREISVLMMALEEHIPQDLMRVHSGEPLQSLAPRLASRLSDQKALAPDASSWAVHAWARGLGMESVAGASLPGDGVHEQSLVPFDQPSVQPARVVPADGTEAGKAVTLASLGETARSNKTPLAIAGVCLAALLAWFFVAQKSFEITRVDTGDALVGDGKLHPVFVDFKPGKVPVKSIQVGYVSGDLAPAPGPLNVTVGNDASDQGRAAAGGIAYRTFKPATATFQYVLVAADGTRSPPFQKTFEIAAAPAQPPSITTIEVPKLIVVGRDFTLKIDYEPGTADVVQVKRRVVDSSVTWAQAETVASVKPVAGAKSVPYTFVAPKLPFKSTVEFILVDASGHTSDPKQVSFEVLPADAVASRAACRYCGTVVAVRAFEHRGESTGVGAVFGGIIGGVLGHQVGSGHGRDAATVGGAVGGAVAGNAIEKNVRSGTTYEVTVRYDTGKTQVFRHSGAGWRKGDRVRVVNGALARE